MFEDEGRCIICEATFRPAVMVGEKCMHCHELYPKAKSKDDIKNPNKPKAETLTEKRVKELIIETLEEANIRRHECEKCKDLYFRTAPAQKICRNCKGDK